jgi:hypothetical protein
MTSSSNPTVAIGLSLSTSPTSLSTSSDEPFYIVVTAKIIKTPKSDRPITLRVHLSPLHHLALRAFDNIVCTTNESKKIEIWPIYRQNFVWDREDIRENAYDSEFITIPPSGQGTYTIRHEVPRSKIEATGIKAGERYRVHINDRCLGTRWWTFASLEELEGVRLRDWHEEPDETNKEIVKKLLETYGDRPTSIGEKPDLLAMVPEGDVEFEIV